MAYKYELCSRPKLLESVSRQMLSKLESLEYDRLVGCELGAVSFVTLMSLYAGMPYLLLRKTVKKYGTQKQLEGRFSDGDRVVLVDDFILNSSALDRLVMPLKEAGLLISGVVCLASRQNVTASFPVYSLLDADNVDDTFL